MEIRCACEADVVALANLYRQTVLIWGPKYYTAEQTAAWARKTVRQVQQLQEIGLALGGAAGSRLGKCLGYFSCGSTQ